MPTDRFSNIGLFEPYFLFMIKHLKRSPIVFASTCLLLFVLMASAYLLQSIATQSKKTHSSSIGETHKNVYQDFQRPFHLTKEEQYNHENKNENFTCERCRKNIELLLDTTEKLHDDNYSEVYLSTINMAEYLKRHPKIIEQLIELTHTIEDGNKRKIIIALVTEIDSSYEKIVGEKLLSTENNLKKIQGIHLLSRHINSDQKIKTRLIDHLHAEPDPYVKKALINTLKKQDLFENDTEVIESLLAASVSDPSPTIRGIALLGSAGLMRNPETIIQESLEASNAKEEVLQSYGLDTLEIILDKTSREGLAINPYYAEQIQQLTDRLMNEEFGHISESTREKLDSLIDRHF